LFGTPLIVKGHTVLSSREYIHESLPPLLARLELWKDQRNKYAVKQQKFKPTPMLIEKELVKDLTKCYEMKWSIDLGDKGTLEFTTIEPQSLVQDSRYSKMCKSFHQEDRRKRQVLDRQKHFIGKKPNAHKRRPLNSKQRQNNFQRSMKPAQGRHRERNFTGASTMSRLPKISEHSHDVEMLMCSMSNDCSNARVHNNEYEHEEVDIQSDNNDPNDEVDVLEESSKVNEPNCHANTELYLQTSQKNRNSSSRGLDGQYSEYEESMGFFDNVHMQYENNQEWESVPEFNTNDVTNNSEATINSHYWSYEPELTFPKDDVAVAQYSPTEGETGDFLGHEMRSYDYDDWRLSHSSGMPSLSPSNGERLYVDLGGISIEVTPIVPRRGR
jgi:hypothetical protein